MARWTYSAEWLSHTAAARLVGCSVSTVEHQVAAGVIEHRERHGERPSLRRASVEAFIPVWRKHVEERERAAAKRAAKPRRGEPPTSDDVWLDTETVSAMLGWTTVWVARLAAEGRLPATKCVGKWWYRRADAERYAAARAFMRRQEEAAASIGEFVQVAA